MINFTFELVNDYPSISCQRSSLHLRILPFLKTTKRCLALSQATPPIEVVVKFSVIDLNPESPSVVLYSAHLSHDVWLI